MAILINNKNNDRVVALIQARMSSSRLPGKMMMDLCGRPVLQWVLERVKISKSVDSIVLATSLHKDNDELENLAGGQNVAVYRGDEDDVLGRYAEAACRYEADIVVRVCADNPLVAPEEIDRLVEFYFSALNNGADVKHLYCFNHIPDLGNNYPDGLGAEVFSRALLDNMRDFVTTQLHREHVTLYVRDNPRYYDIRTIPCPLAFAYSAIKLDVDTVEDLHRLRILCSRLNLDCSVDDIVLQYMKSFGINTK